MVEKSMPQMQRVQSLADGGLHDQPMLETLPTDIRRTVSALPDLGLLTEQDMNDVLFQDNCKDIQSQ